MDGFGNTSGFSTTFGASPFREKLTGYEDIYGEQLGQPALNNLKAPEIEAYKNALTDSPDFEPFMQQRKRVLDLATKAVGAGMNIQNPRTEDEVQYALLFNQEVEKYNQLGRRLEEERKGYEQLIDKVGTQGVVVAPSATGRYGLADVSQSVAQVVSPTQLSTMRRAESFGTQEAADEYTRGSEKIRQSLKAQGLDESNPNLRQAMQDYYKIADALIQDGSFDADMAADMALKQYTARTSRINATKPSGATTPDVEVDKITPYMKYLNSLNPKDVEFALNFTGVQGFKITDDEGKQIEATTAIPLVDVNSKQTTGTIILTADQDLKRKMNNGEVVYAEGRLFKVNSQGKRSDYDKPYRVETTESIAGALQSLANAKTQSIEGFTTGRVKGVEVQSTRKPSGNTPKTNTQKIVVEY